ncbi:MAG: NUDIX domain-containing protein, partial [Thermoplasmatales archaeon]
PPAFLNTDATMLLEGTKYKHNFPFQRRGWKILRKCIVAGVLILSRDGKKVLLVKHRKLGVWIYPGGHIEKNENPLECAIRESVEETGSDFSIFSTDNFTIRDEGAVSLPHPLLIMDEIVPYPDEPHKHFDVIYLGVAESLEFHSNDESTDIRWFEKEGIEDIETFDNVKKIIMKGFDTFHRISSTS